MARARFTNLTLVRAVAVTVARAGRAAHEVPHPGWTEARLGQVGRVVQGSACRSVHAGAESGALSPVAPAASRMGVAVLGVEELTALVDRARVHLLIEESLDCEAIKM